MFENIMGTKVIIIPKYMIGKELEAMINNYESFHIISERKEFVHVLVYIYRNFFEA